MDLRPRTFVDWRKLHTGPSLPTLRSEQRYTALEGTFPVERIIWRRKKAEDYTYLVQWAGYHICESTWEPEDHLPTSVIEDYHQPPADTQRLRDVAVRLERVIQAKLRSRACPVSLDLPLDLYRFIFSHIGGNERECVAEKADFDSIGMSPHWWYKILHPLGDGVRIDFPVRVKPVCRMRRRRVVVDGAVQEVCVPHEGVLLYMSIRACDLTNL